MINIGRSTTENIPRHSSRLAFTDKGKQKRCLRSGRQRNTGISERDGEIPLRVILEVIVSMSMCDEDASGLRSAACCPLGAWPSMGPLQAVHGRSGRPAGDDLQWPHVATQHARRYKLRTTDSSLNVQRFTFWHNVSVYTRCVLFI